MPYSRRRPRRRPAGRDQLQTGLQAPAEPPPDRPHRQVITEEMVDRGEAPIWALRMVRLAPGFYADRYGNIHISQGEVCRHFGVPPTKENLDIVVKAWNDAVRQAYPDQPPPRITEVND